MILPARSCELAVLWRMPLPERSLGLEKQIVRPAQLRAGRAELLPRNLVEPCLLSFEGCEY